jgi:hypothetical protein
MPLIFPPTPTLGDTYTDDNSVVWQFDGVKWDVVTGTTKRLFNGVLLGLSTNYYLTNTLAAIDWDVETADTDNYFNPLDPSKITIPGTGYYNLNLTIFSDNSGAGYTIQVLKNGVTEIEDGVLNPNQAGYFNDTLFFNQGDYFQVLMNETSDVGAITNSSTLELVLMGAAVGTGVSPYSAFSGVKTTLSPAFSTTSTPTAIAWTGTLYDTNANALALTYWNAGTPSRLTIKTPGYYQVNSFLQTAAVGGTYTLTLKKNGITNISTTTLAPNDTATINQIYELNENDYIEVFASDTTSSGNITTESYLEIIRIGV